MKKISKILAMLAVFALALSFAGCKSDDSDSSNSSGGGAIVEAASRFRKAL